MKTRTLYAVRENGRNVSFRLRSRKHALRAVRALRKLGRDAYIAGIEINAQEFDGNGRRRHSPAPVVCVLGRTDIRWPA